LSRVLRIVSIVRDKRGIKDKVRKYKRERRERERRKEKGIE
jgi:hypothetical protein